MCGWGGRYLCYGCLYYGCPVRDTVAQSSIFRVEDSEIDYLFTHLVFGVAILC